MGTLAPPPPRLLSAAALLLGAACTPAPSRAVQAQTAALPAAASPRSASASAGSAWVAPAAPDSAAPVADLAAPEPAAVVELFTSEGCSSCPPADENLARITEDAARTGRRVFTLELHVDYWDYLGWRDPFSAPIHGDRQRLYALHFGRSDVYTPQMIVNGREQFVGSDERTAAAAILRALATEPRVGVGLRARADPRNPGAVRVEYRIGGSGPLDVELALLEDAAETAVPRGENARRTLRHRHVARAFVVRQATAPSAGSFSVPWPASASTDGRLAVVYVSDRETLAVLGAGSARVE